MEPLSNRKIKIYLHGKLQRFSEDPLEVAASTVEEAVHALSHLCPELKKESLRNRPTIQVLGYECEAALREPLGEKVAELHLLPAFVGAGGNTGFLSIAIGAVLVVASGGLAAPSLAALSAFQGALFMAGVGMVLGGLMQIISPSPTRDLGADGTTDPEASKYIGATQNTTKIGTRIPIVYGKIRTGGHYISFDVDAIDVEMEESE